MKKIRLLLLLCFAVYAIPSISQNEVIKNETSGNANFSGRHCRGTNGLCSISEEKSTEGTTTVIGYHHNTITLTIDRNLINTTEETKIVGRPIQALDIGTTLYFTMDDDFTLSASLISQLHISSQNDMILKGEYPVYVTKENLLITFKL